MWLHRARNSVDLSGCTVRMDPGHVMERYRNLDRRRVELEEESERELSLELIYS